MYSKQIFLIDMRIRPFKFAKFVLSDSIHAHRNVREPDKIWLTGRPSLRIPMGTTRAVRAWLPRGHCPPTLVFGRSVNRTSARVGVDYAHYRITFLSLRFSDLPTVLCSIWKNGQIFIEDMFERSWTCNVRTARKMCLQI